MHVIRNVTIAGLMLLTAVGTTARAQTHGYGAYGSGSNSSTTGTSAATVRAHRMGHRTVVVKKVNGQYVFSPKTITIRAGTTVTWTNKSDAPHTVTADMGGAFNKSLNQGTSVSITFKKAGKYHYHCTFHPYMHGVIVVRH